MGYIGNFVAISAFLPLPFAGYYLAKEIYAYNQALGIMMMGGAFSWLFIIQAVLIGNLSSPPTTTCGSAWAASRACRPTRST
jgi:hypothetical protein